MVSINRDPFARTETVRRAVKTTETCACCGSHRPSGKLFQYGTETDGGRTRWFDKLFCSVLCFRSFYS